MSVRKLAARVAVSAVTAAAFTGAAVAAPAAPDTAQLVSFVESMWAPVSAVIAAFTALVIGVKGWKLVRRA